LTRAFASTCAWIAVLESGFWISDWSGRPGRPESQVQAPKSASATQAVSRPSAPVAFQPGIAIDWQDRTVYVAARVVLRRGALEFLACWPGKEHESILRCEAAAAHVYQALGLAGLVPGRPPQWNPDANRYRDPVGDLVDISLSWNQDRQMHTADAFTWLREIEYARPPLSRPWVFAGSVRLPDGTLASDATGVGIAVVDFPDSLIALSRHHSSSNAELWVEANTPAIPPVGTRVQIVVRPARRRSYDVMLDFRGALWVTAGNPPEPEAPARSTTHTAQEQWHRYCSPPDLADLVRLARQLDPDYVQTIEVQGALHADEAALRHALLDAGVPDTALRIIPLPPREGAREGSESRPRTPSLPSP
jgi:hypothetical protein